MIVAVIIIVVLLIPIIAAAAMSEDFEIVADTSINRSHSEVFDYVKYLNNANHYNKWMMQDPDHRRELIGTDGTPGFIYKWDSDNKNVGQGEQEILHIMGKERIDYEIRFIRPFNNIARSSMVLTSAGDGTTNVSWSFGGKRGFGMRIFHFLFNLKNVLRRDLQTSLGHLKNVLEK